MLKDLVFKNRWVLLALLLIFLLLASRLFVGDQFRPGAKKNALPALSGSNTMDISQIEQFDSKVILVYLDNESELQINTEIDVFVFEPEELISRQNMKELKKYKVPIILVSEDPSVSARTWMLLAQKGVRNLYVFGDRESIESFKYEFRPDTSVISVRPELL